MRVRGSYTARTMKHRILVTGSAGLIGSEAVKYFCAQEAGGLPPAIGPQSGGQDQLAQPPVILKV